MTEPDEKFNDALKRTFAAVDSSAVFANLWSQSMEDFVEDPMPAVQLACAIILDKPILLLVATGREETVPRKLRAIAERVLVGGPEEWGKGIKAFMEERFGDGSFQ